MQYSKNHLSKQNAKHIIQSPRILSVITIIFIHLQLTQSGPFLAYCQTIPYNYITTCKSTCETCTQNRNQCSTCPAYLQLSQGSCIATKDQRLIYNEYFMERNLKFNKNLLNFQTSQGLLTQDDVFRFCIANTYKFDIIGLFSSQDQLSFQQTFALQSEQIALNFRLFFTSNTAIIKIYINQKSVYNRTIDTGFTLNMTQMLNDTAQTDSSNINWKIGIIQNDPIAYVDSIFVPIKTGMLPLSSSNANIKITVENGLIDTLNMKDKFWGVSELSIVTKKCKTCVSDSIKRLAAIFGAIIGISAGTVIILILFLYIYSSIKARNYRKKLKKRSFRESQERHFTQNQKRSQRKSEKQRILI